MTQKTHFETSTKIILTMNIDDKYVSVVVNQEIEDNMLILSLNLLGTLESLRS